MVAGTCWTRSDLDVLVLTGIHGWAGGSFLLRLPRAVCFHKSSSPRSIHPSPFQTNERQSWGPDGHERHCVGTCLACACLCRVCFFLVPCSVNFHRSLASRVSLPPATPIESIQPKKTRATATDVFDLGAWPAQRGSSLHFRRIREPQQLTRTRLGSFFFFSLGFLL